MLDYVVIGSGPSAYSVVKSILELTPHAHITVLEAGQQIFNPEHPLGKRASIEQDFKLNPSINVGYGGTSQLWHNVLAPLDEDDFIAKPYIPLSGWPINKEDLVPHYRKVATLFGFDYDIFDSPDNHVPFKDEIDKIKVDPNIYEHKVFVHPLNYLRTNVGFDELLRAYPNINILNGAVALRFSSVQSVDDEQTTLHYYDEDKNRHSTIVAKRFILSAGALNNPEILFNSPELAPNLPMLGKCLMDHPMGTFYQFRYSEGKHAKIYSSKKFAKGLTLKTALRLKASIRTEQQMANSVFYLRPSFAEGYDDKTEALKLELLTVREQLKSGKVPFKAALSIASNLNMAAQIVQYKTGLFSKHRLTDCLFVTEQRPTPESCVTLTTEKNAYGNYKTQVQWQVQETDMNEVYKSFEYIKTGIMTHNDAHETYDHRPYQWQDRLSSAAHHMGTVRMADSVQTGCVDKDLKVFGSHNIYVCDASVFSTGGNANSTFTCMALGSRLAEHFLNG